MIDTRKVGRPKSTPASSATEPSGASAKRFALPASATPLALAGHREVGRGTARGERDEFELPCAPAATRRDRRDRAQALAHTRCPTATGRGLAADRAQLELVRTIGDSPGARRREPGGRQNVAVSGR